MYDMTGPAAEAGMFGYAAHQTVDGIKQRLWARAFIMLDPASNKRLVFVSCDAGAVFQSEKRAVIDQLKKRFPGLYDDANVMITATHTHVGSGGQSHDLLYVMAAADGSGLGWNDLAFQATVTGIVEAIARAHHNLAPGALRLAKGTVRTISLNRAKVPYRSNPDHQRHPVDFNDQMTVLKFMKADGKSVGMINWFALHPTSFSNQYTKLSGDSKGYASHEFEKIMGGNPWSSDTFVAAFANSDEGDVVPVDGNATSAAGFRGSQDEEVNVLAAGKKQLAKGLEIFQSPSTAVGSQIDYRHQWINFPAYVVEAAYTGRGRQQLCQSALGYAFAAGGVNGPSGIPGLRPGMTVENTRLKTAFETFSSSVSGGLVLTALGVVTPAMADPCQAPKPVMLATGTLGLTPQILPIQLFRVGRLAIIGMPFEITTMVGRHLRERVLRQLAGVGVTDVVIAGLANSYAGYMVTYDEYQLQHYEGASTHFGPYQAAALTQMLSIQAWAIAKKQPLKDTGRPPATSAPTWYARPGVVWDGKWSQEVFGQALTDAHAVYKRGSEVTVTFRAGHPKNHLRTMGTFLEVQREDPLSGSWRTVATDNDFETTYQWKREGMLTSIASITWRIPVDTKPGQYRIIHHGHAKSLLDQAIRPYRGVSRVFRVL